MRMKADKEEGRVNFCWRLLLMSPKSVGTVGQLDATLTDHLACEQTL